jgi:hypothetical protein
VEDYIISISTISGCFSRTRAVGIRKTRAAIKCKSQRVHSESQTPQTLICRATYEQVIITNKKIKNQMRSKECKKILPAWQTFLYESATYDRRNKPSPRQQQVPSLE